MSLGQLLITVAAPGLIAALARFIWGPREGGTRAQPTRTGRLVSFEFDRAARLPELQTVPVDLLPERRNEYHFSCRMGMVRGRLVAT